MQFCIKHIPAATNAHLHFPLLWLETGFWQTSHQCCQHFSGWNSSRSQADCAPQTHQPYRNILGDTGGHSLGEPRDERFSPWSHWALSGTIIKPQTWFYHSWKELVTAACPTHPVFFTDLFSGCAEVSPLFQQLPGQPPVLEASRADELFPEVEAQPQLWRYKCWAQVNSCVIFTGKTPTPWACTYRPNAALLSCTTALQVKHGSLCLIPGDFESCWCASFESHLFQWGALRQCVCVRSTAGTTELWAFGASMYYCDLRKTTAWILGSKILNTAHLLSPIIIIYLCIM